MVSSPRQTVKATSCRQPEDITGYSLYQLRQSLYFLPRSGLHHLGSCPFDSSGLAGCASVPAARARSVQAGISNSGRPASRRLRALLRRDSSSSLAFATRTHEAPARKKVFSAASWLGSLSSSSARPSRKGPSLQRLSSPFCSVLLAALSQLCSLSLSLSLSLSPILACAESCCFHLPPPLRPRHFMYLE